ncbi:hypothetical protein BDN71DRAFT_1051802 [Pleurotus eryngii]|uniref:Uncharacterized protein n=1 Tax=Pleurotus eryngii TaxID=5323 RepID=A0A9P5ZUB3_PLEER|nr:hypothetical protein BDN71DRAFT_1051802 [Pleurotus eryngii]
MLYLNTGNTASLRMYLIRRDCVTIHRVGPRNPDRDAKSSSSPFHDHDHDHDSATRHMTYDIPTVGQLGHTARIQGQSHVDPTPKKTERKRFARNEHARTRIPRAQTSNVQRPTLGYHVSRQSEHVLCVVAPRRLGQHRALHRFREMTGVEERRSES